MPVHTHNNRVRASNAPRTSKCALFVASGRHSVPSWVLVGGAITPWSTARGQRRRPPPSWTRNVSGIFMHVRASITHISLSLSLSLSRARSAAMQIVPVINPESGVFYERERIKRRPKTLLLCWCSKWAEIFSRHTWFLMRAWPFSLPRSRACVNLFLRSWLHPRSALMAWCVLRGATLEE